jgi:O-antigen/teichoic acid export membrane protein
MSRFAAARDALIRAIPHRRFRPERFPAFGAGLVVAAEGVAAVLGFLALIHLTRRLGPSAFARVEYAAAVLAWLMILVRGGFDPIVYREASRRPRLIGPWTDFLIGHRILGAGLGYLAAFALAWTVGPERGSTTAVAALALFASAWCADVGSRVEGRLGWVALSQVARGAGLLIAVLWLVRGQVDASGAAWALVIAEVAASAGPLYDHVRRHGRLFPRLRGRETRVVTRRAGAAGLARLLRVSLYGLDLLALGWWTGAEVGGYAAGRRVVFALTALGLAATAAVAPSIAASWRAGPSAARRRVGEALSALWSMSVPAAVGLAVVSDRAAPWLFGPSFRDAAPWLALAAARLPWMLAAAFALAALSACRHERLGLRVVLGQTAMAAVVVPAGLAIAGPSGVGWAMLAVEAAGAVGGWAMLAKLDAAPRWTELLARPLAGSLGLIAACGVAAGADLGVTIACGAIGYALAWRFAARLGRFETLTDWGPRG